MHPLNYLDCDSFVRFILSRNYSSDKLIIFSILTRLDSRLNSPYAILDSRYLILASFELKETVNLHLSGTVLFGHSGRN